MSVSLSHPPSLSLTLSLSLTPPSRIYGQQNAIPSQLIHVCQFTGLSMPIFTQFLQADCQPFNKFLQMYTRCSIGPTIFKKMNSARFQCLSEMCAGPSYQPLLPPLLSQTIQGLFSQFITFQPVENIQSPQSQQLYPVGKRDSRTW